MKNKPQPEWEMTFVAELDSYLVNSRRDKLTRHATLMEATDYLVRYMERAVPTFESSMTAEVTRWIVSRVNAIGYVSSDRMYLEGVIPYGTRAKTKGTWF